MKLLGIIWLIALAWMHPLFAKDINIGFEPFPPLINENGQGHVVNMLRAIEKNSNYRFNIKIMTYGRAKLALKNEQLDLIGLTPQQLETEDFYHYAQDLNWHIDAHVDIFASKKKLLDITSTPNASIGTLIGNADFFSELLNIPRTKFVEVTSLEQLVKMLAKGRLELATFERVAMMSTIKRLKVKNIYYQKFGVIPASMAVANNTTGLALKNELDKLLAKVAIDLNNSQLQYYRSLPSSGIVNITK